MSKKRRIWRALACLAILSLLALAVSGCTTIQIWRSYRWCDTWGCHVERRKVTVVHFPAPIMPFRGRSQVETQADAIAGQPQPVIAMQVPAEYLAVPYPWIVVIKPEVGTEQTLVISPIPIYDPAVVNELEAQWPSPPGNGWRVFGVNPSDVARIEEALPPSGPFEVRAEAVFSFHAAVIEPTVVIAEFDFITQEWIPSPYVHAPEVPLLFEPHVSQKVIKPNTMLTFTHTLTNTATIARTFDLTYVSDLGWTYVIALAQAPGTPVTDTGPVAPGESVDVLVSTWIPQGTSGAVDTLVVTATAQDAPAVTQSVVNRIYVWHVSFLPMIRNGTG